MILITSVKDRNNTNYYLYIPSSSYFYYLNYDKYVYISVCIYIYRERERQRDRETYYYSSMRKILRSFLEMSSNININIIDIFYVTYMHKTIFFQYIIKSL